LPQPLDLDVEFTQHLSSWKVLKLCLFLRLLLELTFSIINWGFERSVALELLGHLDWSATI